jgi:hypothetical protein
MTTLPMWASKYDEVAWEPGYGPGEVHGECKHDCDHRPQRAVATGPDERRKMLVACLAPACNLNPRSQCRAWFTFRDMKWGPWRGVWIPRSD